MNTCRLGCACAIVLAYFALPGSNKSGLAQPFPAKPINMIAPYAAGGPTDTVARLVAEPMRRFFGQPMVVENITGAGGSIATARVARATPDGYTLSIGHWGSHVVNGAYYSNLPFDLRTDFEPIALIASNPQLLISKLSVPAKNLKELIPWLKANHDKAMFGSGGVGASSHIGGAYFLNRIGVKMEFVPYRGGAPAMQALLSGEFELYMTQISGAVGHIRAGKLRAYLVSDKKRQAIAPEIPTSDEAGLPGLYNSIWHGLWAPKGTPRDVIAKLNAAAVDALMDDALRKRFADLGQEIPPRNEQTPQALGAFHKAEIDKWWPLMRAAGIKAE